MASPSSGPYQSRLFNWISQGLGQLGQLQPHIRWLKMRVAWGAQLVFYLAYGLVQTTRLIGQRLGQTIQQQLATGTTSSSQPIQQILLEVKQSYLSPGLETTNSTLSPSRQDVCAAIPVQGIATLLEPRTLVLVTEQNQLLDILTPDQQKRLHHRIIWKVSGYMPSFDFRVERLRSLTSNLDFGLTASSQPKIANLKSKIGGALGLLDAVSLQLEQQVGQIVCQVQQGLGQRFQNLMPAQKAARADHLTIRALIQAAITYFFGQQPSRFLSQSSSTQAPSFNPGNSAATSISGAQQSSQGQSTITGSTKSRSTRRIRPGQEEPWLTLADLFGNPAEASLASSASGVASVSMTSQTLAEQEAGGRRNKETVLHPSSFIPHPSLGQPESSPTVDGNWIDIEAESILMGYVKHPLQQILEWLDRGLAWLEGLIVDLWTHLWPYLLALFQLIQQYWRRWFQ